MGYQTIKDGIRAMLISKEFVESEDPFSFEGEGDQTDRKFRIERAEVDLEADGTEFLINLIRHVSRFKLVLCFRLASEQRIGDYDVSQNVVDVLLSYFNNPTNYQSYAIKMKTNRVKTTLNEDRMEAEIDLEVLDDITLT